MIELPFFQKEEVNVQIPVCLSLIHIFPQELYDEKENKITEEDLNSGDVVKIWGNEAIAQSYPAQYPGITKIQIEEKENKEYIEKYGHYLEEFIAVPDETELPYLDISYKQPNALVTAAVDTVASYIWEYSGDDCLLYTSTMEANAQGLRCTKQAISLLADQELKSSALELEKAIIKGETCAIVDKCFELGMGDLALGVIRAVKAGVIDIPFAPVSYTHLDVYKRQLYQQTIF